ncbi:protein-L-isoaspartate O-methyltransferase domain-containing protein 2-like [Tenebrio molitor]|jgi:protein-L-isoaspartate O-methyltransferase|uniref:protein-L-isoaspartate O-methyltransferase domain-containing protein 2-like n=1 Tax=Tenebrio molitor TaxID=7067 RepID=UPI001C39A24C|nr:unnamed protein product [Tenebrio molitor]
MGAGVSAGENNDELVDNLIEANYIKTSTVERVLRAVDRGAYFLPDPPADAYRDVAWKNGNFHISAPCIYSEVMEGLKLRPGLSFLNLGSGTGYLNTVAGLLLGTYGINHGIEIHENVIEYAYMRLEDFKKHSGAMDEFDFCEPKFMQGNCLSLPSGYHQYDRVYCGAACPEKYLSYMKNLIKVGGTLVIPINERLIEMRRMSETSWNTHYLLSVSFTTLIKPEQVNQETVPFFDIEPLSLQELCRTTVRNLLRRNIELEHPKVKSIKKCRRTLRKKKPGKREGNNRRDTRKDFIEFFLLTMGRKKKRRSAAAAHDRDNDESSGSSSANNDTDGPSSDSDESSADDPMDTAQRACRILGMKPRTNNASTSSGNSNNNETEEASSSKQIATEVTPEEMETESKVIVHRENITEVESCEPTFENIQKEVSFNVTVESVVIDGEEKLVNVRTGEVVDENKQKTHQQGRLDNGSIDDEIIISDLPVDVVKVLSSSSDDDQDNKRCKRGLKEKEKKLSSKWRKIDRVDVPKKYSDSEDSTDNEDKSDSESEFVEMMNRKKMYISPYTAHMRNKIQQLPLPSNVKKFLNFYREF